MKKSKIVLLTVICLTAGIFMGIIIHRIMFTVSQPKNPLKIENDTIEYLPKYIPNQFGDLDESFIYSVQGNDIDIDLKEKLFSGNNDTMTDETDIINEAAEKYEKIIDKALDIIDEKSDTEAFKAEYKNFEEEYCRLAHAYKDETVGHGSGDNAYIGYMYLVEARELSFRLAECIYMCEGINIFENE